MSRSAAGAATADGSVSRAEEITRLHFALGRSSRLLRESATGGLTPTQLAVLGALLRDGPRQLTELASAEHINPTLLSRVVGRLEDAGYVLRTSLEQDRRAYLVSITEQGSSLVAALRRERGDELGAVVAQLEPHLVAALFAALPALESLADQLMLHRKG